MSNKTNNIYKDPKRFLVLSAPLVIILYAIIINYANENNWIALHILLAMTAFISVFSVWQIKLKSYLKKTTGINKKDRLSTISKILFTLMSLTFLIIFLISVESIITGTKYYQGDCVTRYSQNNGKGGGWTLIINDQGVDKNINITANEAKLLTGTNNTFDYLEYKCTTGVKITYLKNLGIRIKLEKFNEAKLPVDDIWQKYENTSYNFRFYYPRSLKLTNDNKSSSFNIYLFDDSQELFRIHVYKPKWNDSDEFKIREETINGNLFKVLLFPTGLDSGDFTLGQPILYYIAYQGDFKYSFQFNNREKLTSLQKSILSTFEIVQKRL